MQTGEFVETAGVYQPWVLVADDDPDTRTILSELLRLLGYRFLLAEDGEQAWMLINQHALDLALLDIRLPGMSGLDLLVYLKATQPPVEAIMITALDEAAPAVQAMRGGAFDYLTKPFHTCAVVATVQRAWAAKQARTQVQLDDVTVDLHTGQIKRASSYVLLSPLEKAVLLCLVQRRGEVLTYQELWCRVWRSDGPPDKNLVQRTVSYLRKRIGQGKIRCVRGQGYVIP